MVDLNGQYLKIKKEVDKAIQNVIDTSSFINGSQVNNFSINLGKYLKSELVVTGQMPFKLH